MRYRYFPALIFALIFSVLLLLSSTICATSEKHELTTVNHLILYNQGKVICQGDTEERNAVIEYWLDDFSHLAAAGEGLYEAAPIVLESLDASELKLYLVSDNSFAYQYE